MKHCYQFKCSYLLFALLWIWSFPFLSASSQAQEQISDVVEKAKPSVVLIWGLTPGDTTIKELGTGFIITEKGDIITNYHVIDPCIYAVIELSNRKAYEVKGIVAKDEKEDLVRLALRDIDTTFQPLTIFDSVKVPEEIFVIGHPFGRFEWSTSFGRIQAFERYLPEVDASFLQHDAMVYEGSSGSPLFNLQGEVIGVHALTYNPPETILPVDIPIHIPTNIHFAIPASKIADLQLQELMTLPEERANKDTIWANSPEGLYYLGNALCSIEEYDEALLFFQKALKNRKNDPKIYFKTGYCFDNLFLLDSVIVFYEHAISTNSNFFDAWFHLGGIYHFVSQVFEQQRYKEAAGCYEQARRIQPNDLETLCNLGDVYVSLNKPVEAVGVLKEALKIAPDSCCVHLTLGKAYFALKRFKEAEKATEIAMALTSKDSTDCWYDAYNLSVDIYNSLPGEGIRFYLHRFITVEPRQTRLLRIPDIIYNWPQSRIDSAGWCLSEQAEQLQHAWPQICRDSAGWHVIGGIIGEDRKDYEEAQQRYKRAIEICSVYVPGYKSLVALYSKLGRYQDAAEVLDYAIRVRDCFVWAYHAFVIISSILDPLSVSDNLLERIQNDNDEPYKGACAMDGNFSNAWGCWIPAIAPDTAFKCCALGVVCEHQGDTTEAIDIYKQAIQIYPNFPEAHFLLGRAYVSKGDIVSALRELKILNDLNDFLADKLLTLIYPE